MDPIYGRICSWAFIRLHEPNCEPTVHLVGYIARHDRLSDKAGHPYVGSSLREIDLQRARCRTARGRVIALIGDPLPPGDLPKDIADVLRRAEVEWALRGHEWARIDLAALLAAAERAPE